MYIISNRLKHILNSITSPEQQCGLPNCQIFKNHLNILSAINYFKDFQQPLAIVQFDFYKAFDSISHKFLLKTASKLGIPDSLLTWIQIFLSHLSAKLNLKGYLSDSISVKRGMCQGCSLSVFLFIISIKPLSQKILFSTKIQGISLGKLNLKVSHYADDLTFFITSPHSFLPPLEILDDFSNFSGLKINHSKTTIILNSLPSYPHFTLYFRKVKL